MDIGCNLSLDLVSSTRDQSNWLDPRSAVKAAALVALSTALYSLIPLVIDLSVGAGRRPFTVGSGVVAGWLVSNLLLRELLPTRGYGPLTLTGLWRRCRSPAVAALAVVGPLACTAVGGFTFVAFAWSSAHVDTAVTACVFQLWGCGWFFVMRCVDAHRVGPHPQTPVPLRVYALGVAALGGAVLTVLSIGGTSSADGSAVAGVALAAVSALLVAMTAVQFLAVDRIIYGSRTDRDRRAAVGDRWTARALEQFSALQVEESVTQAVLPAARLLTLAGALTLAVNESGWGAVTSWPFAAGLAAGALLAGPGSYLMRRTMFLCPRREIIAIYCLEPAMVTTWLWLWRGLDVGRPGLLVAGVAVVTICNLLMHNHSRDPVNVMSGLADSRELSRRDP